MNTYNRVFSTICRWCDATKNCVVANGWMFYRCPNCDYNTEDDDA